MDASCVFPSVASLTGRSVHLLAPVLYTVGLKATFCNINRSAWTIWAAQAVRKKKVDLSFSEQLLRVVFSTFCGQKKFKFLF